MMSIQRLRELEFEKEKRIAEDNKVDMVIKRIFDNGALVDFTITPLPGPPKEHPKLIYQDEEIGTHKKIEEPEAPKATLPLSVHRIMPSNPFRQSIKAAIPLSVYRTPAKPIERRRVSIPISVHRARASPVLLPKAIVGAVSPEEKESELPLEKRKRERLRA